MEIKTDYEFERKTEYQKTYLELQNMNYKPESDPNHTQKYMPSDFQENVLSQKSPTVMIF